MTPHILVVYASSHGQTQKIARVIAERLRANGCSVALTEASASALSPEAFDAVVLGSRVHFGKHARALLAYIRRCRDALAARPAYFFSVCNAVVGHHGEPDPEGYLRTTFAATGWSTENTAVFAGALPYTRYGWLTRRIMRSISRRGGHPTDITRDHELTDWGQVAAFADTIAKRNARSPGAAHG